MMAQVIRLEPMPPSDSQKAARKKARKRANYRIAFMGHAVVWAMTSVFLLVVAGAFPMMVVALSWGIGLAAHGFFSVLAPQLREQWIEQEVNNKVTPAVVRERRSLGEEHARQMHRLSASVAHEIRNPITAAKSLVQQMGEDPNAPENVEYAKIAIEELDRVEKSISHLLRYAREEELDMADIHLTPVVESALETLQDRVGSTDMRIKLCADDALRGDAEALRRVVLNLVGNALDALDDKRPTAPFISIESGHNLASDMLWLAVRDNGPGIDSARTEEIFSPFHTSKAQGTGLGLAITKKLVESHGGTIEVNPSITDGTEIVVTLPRAVAALGVGA